MVELSVCIPMFRSKYCGWIALESLVRQEDINFEWELVVAEEIGDEPFTKKRIMEYQKKLRNIGCAKITYIPMKYWTRLSNKLVLMAHRCDKKSKIYVSNSADLYSPPKRLKMQYDIFMNNNKIDICSSARTIVYDIASEKTYLNDGVKKLEKNKKAIITDGSCRSIRLALMRQLPRGANRRRSVDGWVWNESKKHVEKNGKKFIHSIDITSDNWKYGLNVHGLNTLTLGIRENRFKGKNRPYYVVDCPIDIRDTIPLEILERLIESKKYLSKHKRSTPKWIPHLMLR